MTAISTGRRPALPGLAYEEIHLAIRVRQCQTAMDQALAFEPESDEARVHDELEVAKFDQAPVIQGGVPTGYVLRRELAPSSRRPVGAVAHPLEPSVMVSADAPLGRALSWLAAKSFLFVLDGVEISGFVTPSDVNKQPGRTYLFLLIAELELAMSEIVRAHHPDQKDAIELLGRERIPAVHERYEEEQRLNVEADLVSCVQFADLLTITGKSPACRSAFSASSRSEWDRLTGSLDGLRNAVMHPVRPILNDRRSLKELVELSGRLEALLWAFTTGGDQV